MTITSIGLFHPSSLKGVVDAVATLWPIHFPDIPSFENECCIQHRSVFIASYSF